MGISMLAPPGKEVHFGLHKSLKLVPEITAEDQSSGWGDGRSPAEAIGRCSGEHSQPVGPLRMVTALFNEDFCVLV